MSVLRALVLVWLAGVAPALAAGPTEYQVKAVFLFNFAQFVVWPPQALGAADAPFSICIVGEDPFGAELDVTVRGENVQGHPFAVRRYRDPGDIESACHIVFIGASQLTQLEKIVKSLGDRAILTVSDIDHSAERGTMIQFASEHNRLRLRINIAAAKAAGLTISSKLLRPSQIIGPEAG
ncbi:MAG TPA: YfiR family protein [Steroidobacteraceae bacterium]|nr:YfiR family protein [Steroidobacteraceae bacterium]